MGDNLVRNRIALAFIYCDKPSMHHKCVVCKGTLEKSVKGDGTSVMNYFDTNTQRTFGDNGHK